MNEPTTPVVIDTTDPILNDKITLAIDQIFTTDHDDIADGHRLEKMASEVGLTVQTKMRSKSKLLNKPLIELMRQDEENDKIMDNLNALKDHVESLNPTQIDQAQSWLLKLVQKLPYVDTPVQKYMTKHTEGRAAIDTLIKTLTDGATRLSKDNDILMADQREMQVCVREIEKEVNLGMMIDQEIERRLCETDETKSSFISKRFVFPLRQRILDLQQQLAIFKQGIMSTELIIDNNKELTRSVSRVLSVTVPALEVATSIAFALSHQKNLLDKIDSVNETTSNLIEQNARNIKSHGTHIHKQASRTMISVERFTSSMNLLKEALAEVDEFRSHSLIEMRTSMNEYEMLLKLTPVKEIDG